MSPRKKETNKEPTTEASGSGQQIEDKFDVVGAMYDDTYGLRWGACVSYVQKIELLH
jgi:hypothetical protein